MSPNIGYKPKKYGRGHKNLIRSLLCRDDIIEYSSVIHLNLSYSMV